MDDAVERLRPLREHIDTIDEKILNLLKDRACVALEVGKVKQNINAEGSILKPDREANVIRHLQQKNSSPLPNEAVAAVWGEIISACRGLERVLNVSYLGPKGSFSEQAAWEHFGHSVHNLPVESFDEVFRLVETQQADVGIVPVENSTEGAVGRTLDLLLHGNVKILGERSLRIEHHLMTKSGDLSGVTTIMAHPQALSQCQVWLNQHYPKLKRVPASSNSEAARMADQDKSIAAIAGKTAAQAWELKIVDHNIQGDPHNSTRFLAIGRIEPLVTGHDKTSLILSVPHRAGAVYEMLAPLAENKISMTRFESRPARTGQWEYYFYIDVLGHHQEPAMGRALAGLKSRAAFIKILGSYPTQQ